MGRLAREAERLLRLKREAAKRLESLLAPETARQARRDHHARRKPRPCGITIHTGVGCSYGCIYCYIWDMGFPGRPEPYPLPPEAVAYALALNPWVVPERTFAAYGSVTEPFLPETRDWAVRLIELVGKHLRLPSQVSTKTLLDPSLAQALARADPGISVLVTVVALGDLARRLEPRAPPAEERIRSAGDAARRGLGAALFVRPIIPGVTDRQAPRIFELARESGVRDAVLGSLRITRGILARLRTAGIRIPRRMIPREPRGREQVTLHMGSVKRRVEQEAIRHGIRVYRAACMHNVHTHRLPCNRCRLGPCYATPPTPDPEDAEETLRILGYPGTPRITVNRGVITIRGSSKGRKAELAVWWLREISGYNIKFL